MRIRLLISAVLLASSGAAAGEDFTGFYAGVNAGYGLGRGATGPVRGLTPGGLPDGGGLTKPGGDLPPSAARAADREGSPAARRHGR